MGENEGDLVEHDEANAERIVACVNDCEGMADPGAEIAKLRQDKAELLDIRAGVTGFLDRAEVAIAEAKSRKG